MSSTFDMPPVMSYGLDVPHFVLSFGWNRQGLEQELDSKMRQPGSRGDRFTASPFVGVDAPILLPWLLRCLMFTSDLIVSSFLNVNPGRC